MTRLLPGEAVCRSEACRALIRLARNAATGRWVPLDHRPISRESALADPNHVYILDPAAPRICEPWIPVVPLRDGQHLHRSHFLSCADPGRFSRGRAAGAAAGQTPTTPPGD